MAQTRGILNLPNNVILLAYIKIDKGDDYLIVHLGNCIKFQMKPCVAHQIEYLTFVFSKERYNSPNAVKTADVTCVRLY